MWPSSEIRTGTLAAATVENKTAPAAKSMRNIRILLLRIGEDLREQRCRFGDPVGGASRQGVERVLEPLVDHAGADVGPARSLVLLCDELVLRIDLAADRFLERSEVERGLRLQTLVEEAADLEKFVDRLVDLLFG